MSAVRTFKAMDYSLRVLGFWPQDLLAVGVLIILVQAFTDSLTWDLLGAVPALWLAYRGRQRTPGYLRGMILFVRTPRRLGVGYRREMIAK